MKTLRQKSIEIILENQHSSGSYIASPNFPTYAYSWFRDGTYIAYAMDRVGQHHSAKAFYLWCAKVMVDQTQKIQTLIEKKKLGQHIAAEEALTARYTMQGQTTGDDWTDFQLDGYGTWLWGVSQHLEITNDLQLIPYIKQGVKLTVDYLTHLWDHPCYDCWEEHLDFIHTYTVASILNGLKSIQKYATAFDLDQLQLTSTIEAITTFIDQNLIHMSGYYQKMIHTTQSSPVETLVDASLLGLFMPIQLKAFNHPVMQATLQKIEQDLVSPSGGVHRYLEDEYYGGGEWILLTAWLGWVSAANHDLTKAKQIRTYIESKQNPQGNLPEQISENVLRPNRVQPWVEKWGPIATPLLWSHAMYLILDEEIKKNE
jgi:GH15 family glucan-1,4-alpha-glucosidase